MYLLNGIFADVPMFSLSLNTSNKQVIKSFNIWNKLENIHIYIYTCNGFKLSEAGWHSVSADQMLLAFPNVVLTVNVDVRELEMFLPSFILPPSWLQIPQLHLCLLTHAPFSPLLSLHFSVSTKLGRKWLMLSYQPVLHPPMPMCSSTCSSATMAETESLFSEDIILPFSPQPASNIHWIIFDSLTFTHMFQKCIKASKCFWEGWQNRLNSYTNLFSFHRKGGKKKKVSHLGSSACEFENTTQT